MLNKISIQGFSTAVKGRTLEMVGREHTTPIRNAVKKFDGYKLDELQITVTLTTKQDFEELIHLLEVHKNCFIK